MPIMLKATTNESKSNHQYLCSVQARHIFYNISYINQYHDLLYIQNQFHTLRRSSSSVQPFLKEVRSSAFAFVFPPWLFPLYDLVFFRLNQLIFSSCKHLQFCFVYLLLHLFFKTKIIHLMRITRGIKP